eukprot:TRINITY_DN3337_c0_g1_i1.p1 TRINITY_DN3337_c0_g1~~TRINITY_DN3337_c0_g1_i1.p1  ORF type:complete len:115 (-),score=38.66 TRINITY_DN3337_c0_g1_i1:59-403(-)
MTEILTVSDSLPSLPPGGIYQTIYHSCDDETSILGVSSIFIEGQCREIFPRGSFTTECSITNTTTITLAYTEYSDATCEGSPSRSVRSDFPTGCINVDDFGMVYSCGPPSSSFV